MMAASQQPPPLAPTTDIEISQTPQKKRGRPKNKDSASSPKKRRDKKESKKSVEEPKTPSSPHLPLPSPASASAPEPPPPQPPPFPTESEKQPPPHPPDLGADAYGFFVDRFSGHSQSLPTLLAPEAWHPHVLPRIISYSATMASDVADLINSSNLKLAEKDPIVKKASTLYALLDKLSKEVLVQMSDGIASSVSRLSNSETMGHGVLIPPPTRTVVTSGKALTSEDGVASHKKRQRRSRKPVSFTIQSKGVDGEK
jgi:hypothetical protein